MNGATKEVVIKAIESGGYKVNGKKANSLYNGNDKI
jgi:hypothetical protein